MAQFRQSGAERFTARGQDFRHSGNGSAGAGLGSGVSDQISVRIPHKLGRFRRRPDKIRKASFGSVVLILLLIFSVTLFASNLLTRSKEDNRLNNSQENDGQSDMTFLSNVTKTERHKVLKFGHGSVTFGRDSRYWDKDDRRRDDEYDADAVGLANADSDDQLADKDDELEHQGSRGKRHVQVASHKSSTARLGEDGKSGGLYNEAGRDELKLYEAEYEASLKNAGKSRERNYIDPGLSNGRRTRLQNEDAIEMDHYDDIIDFQDSLEVKKHDDVGNNGLTNLDWGKIGAGINEGSNSMDDAEIVDQALAGRIKNDSSHLIQSAENFEKKSTHGNFSGAEFVKVSSPKNKTDYKKKRRKHSGPCDLKLFNSTSQLVEPLASKKFARFSLQYTEVENWPNGSEFWEPRFAGHSTLQEREDSFYARDKRINCGFIKVSPGYSSTGFDLSEDDAKFMSTCHIAVSSCIFGNSDNLRTPNNRQISRSSRKNVCFIMFMDENTLQTLSSEGHKPDNMGFIGLWKIVLVKNLPYTDMRRVGKIPKFLTHRLFPSARYSIWVDSKLRLTSDPVLILEYFLWRHGYEYAISNHYDRHCMWEEVMQNKKLNKFNHSLIDEQFAFYQKDGLTRFNASDPNKLLPSNVPEGSFIVREHTPMSNLFSCLWFNEVDRFTPRDQLSFAYTYLKLRRMNPGRNFYLNMFKDCERRSVTKLYHHRVEDKHTSQAIR